jgi:hypothetical protein
VDAKLNDLPQDRESLQAILRALILERDEQSKRVHDLQVESLRQRKRADELHLENLRLQLELERYKKWHYGPRGDRLATSGDVAQALLEFAEQLESKPIHPEDVPAKAESEYELRRVKRRPGRRHLASFENLPVTTQVYELSAEQRICPGCGVERKEIGADESWQIEYIPGRFERLLMVRELAIMHTAMFDAWTRYDAMAMPTLGHPSRRPEEERTRLISARRSATRLFGYLTICFLPTRSNLSAR